MQIATLGWVFFKLHFILALLLCLPLLNSVATAQIQVIGGSASTSNQQTKRSMTVDDVIRLSKAGISYSCQKVSLRHTIQQTRTAL